MGDSLPHHRQPVTTTALPLPLPFVRKTGARLAPLPRDGGSFFEKVQASEKPISPFSEGGGIEIPESRSPSPKERGAFYGLCALYEQVPHFTRRHSL